ncbi:SRPBCC family protein [Ramlibacter alkalitolerans]|uniref:SRPBCC family protein n=1 Tax=Ramlibacter alkalitolerans TaxID=2039631 RepID=A0ABS1JL50_9BURK|nr:SRPBCC family protein [Ramlibacter alkalitolerans]MBL0424960.1 SRPBCC family protein [Ramlibacter alkalitolerans]
MKVQLEKSFALGGPAAAAWTLLQDLEAVAACMPGARITERVDDRHVKGTVTVKLGPASLAFRGEVEVKDVDAAARSLFLVGRGTDTTGTSGAAMDLRAHIEEAGTTACRLVGAAEVSVSGKAATFGGRLMSAVADQVLQQFAANFAEKLRSLPVQAPDEPAARPAEAAPAEPAPNPPPAAKRELNGLALLWAMFRAWLHDLFPARRA